MVVFEFLQNSQEIHEFHEFDDDFYDIYEIDIGFYEFDYFEKKMLDEFKKDIYNEVDK